MFLNDSFTQNVTNIPIRSAIFEFNPSVLLPAIQWIIFIVGTVGNLLVLFVLLWRPSDTQKFTQLFVGSLSATNLGMMFSAWIQATYFSDSDWKFGTAMCKFHFFNAGVTINISSWTNAILALDRQVEHLS